jgi:hypothetical protein
MLPREIWAYMVEIAPSAELIAHMMGINTDFRALIAEIAQIPQKPFNYTRVVINKAKYNEKIINHYARLALWTNNMQFLADFNDAIILPFDILYMIKYTKSRDIFAYFNANKNLLHFVDVSFTGLYNAYQLLRGKFNKMYWGDDIASLILPLMFSNWKPEYEALLGEFHCDDIVCYAFMFGNYEMFIKYYDDDNVYYFSEVVIKNDKIGQIIHYTDSMTKLVNGTNYAGEITEEQFKIALYNDQYEIARLYNTDKYQSKYANYYNNILECIDSEFLKSTVINPSATTLHQIQYLESVGL